jgi:predicted transcriptional regulator
MKKALDSQEQLESNESWIPESFRRGMADAEAGRFADMETVLSDAPPSPSRREK